MKEVRDFYAGHVGPDARPRRDEARRGEGRHRRRHAHRDARSRKLSRTRSRAAIRTRSTTGSIAAGLPPHREDVPVGRVLPGHRLPGRAGDLGERSGVLHRHRRAACTRRSPPRGATTSRGRSCAPRRGTCPSRSSTRRSRCSRSSPGRRSSSRAGSAACAASTARLGELLAQPYVAAKFARGLRKRARRSSSARSPRRCGRTLVALPWMDDATREAALAKLAKVHHDKVGYPDKWRTYDFDVSRSDYAANAHGGRPLRASPPARARSASRSTGRSGA